MLSPGGGPRRGLLDAAHIVMDEDEQLGQPVISNGLPLTKIHHAAFDAHLIGIDPDFRIHVSDRLLKIHDGPFLELGLKGIAETLIDRPRRSEHCPIETDWRCGLSNSRKPLYSGANGTS
jgi:putative restriction endonuclease